MTLCSSRSLHRHTGICSQWRKKFFCNSHCSDLLITPEQDILLSDFEKDPINFGLFLSFLQIGIYCTRDWCSATCVKQLHARKKYCFTTIIYSFLNSVLGFFSFHNLWFLFAQCSALSKCFRNSTAKLTLDASRECQCYTSIDKRKNKKENSSLFFISAPSPCLPSQTRGFWEKNISLQLGDPAGPQAGNTVVAWTVHIRDVPARGHGERGRLTHIWDRFCRVLWGSRMCLSNPQYI